MKNLFKSTLLLLSVAFMLNACDGAGESLINERLEDNPLPTPPAYTSGSADFSNFIAIGNSLTAGYMDGALYTLGQQNSIPAIMAGAFAQTTDGDYTFNQPDINSEFGYNTVVAQNPGSGVVLGRFQLDTSIPGPSPTVTGSAVSAYSGPSVNNFGVPGIVVGQLLTAATGGPESPQNPAFNPFYARFAASPGSSTILGEAIAAQPTFFSLWIGSNDILGYAASGAANPAILTADADFETQYNAVLDQLMANTSANGVVVNIPPFLGTPLFQAVRWNNITLDEATASVLNQNLQSVNGAIMGCASPPLSMITSDDANRRMISYAAGNNPVLVIDEELADLGTCFDALMGAGQISAQQRAQLAPYEQSRPMVENELILFSAATVLGTEADGDATVEDTPIGVVIPLGFDIATGNLSGDQYYLSLAEIQEINNKLVTFNTTIATAVGNYPSRLALYNTHSASGAFYDLLGLSDGVPGITVEGVNLAPDFSPNGVMSTDGIHPNPRGSALLASEMIELIESKFGASLPSVDITNRPGVIVCPGTGVCASNQ